ncbi:MAG: cupin domain-containing protein [Sphingomonadales bacterium]|nr:cupin domain-containing protein [Sphingomonadales bacterium]MDE2569237.1 cupin domain-containing protein [Sphingomonadales bacterium]
MTPQAQQLIDAFGLSPHPEGGHFRETWRSPADEGRRGASTAILFLLASGERSHWHRVDADEIWLWHGGDVLTLSLAKHDAGPVEQATLGGDPMGGGQVQGVVPAGWWQAAEPVAGGTHGYVLVSCIVAPAFDFAGFELAPPGWAPGT